MSMMQARTSIRQDDADTVEAVSLSLEPATRDLLHLAFCDNCETLIIGIRYKCSNCPDYDLCSACMDVSGHDPTHVFICLRHPIQSPDLLPVPLHFPLLQDDEGDPTFICTHCKEEKTMPCYFWYAMWYSFVLMKFSLHCRRESAAVCELCLFDHEDHHAMFVFHTTVPMVGLQSVPRIRKLFCHCAIERMVSLTSEMAKKAELPPNSWEIVDMDMSHLDEVKKLDQECFKHAWPPETFDELLGDERYRQTISAIACVTTPQARELDGNLGIVLGYSISQKRSDNSAYVMSLAIASGYRRMGIGRQLLTHILEMHYEKGIETATLQYVCGLVQITIHSVNTRNPSARALYERLGFFSVEFVDNYYQKDGDAYFMKAVLPPSKR